VAALAVDQHQRVIGADPAQRHIEREIGGIAPERLCAKAGQALAQNLAQVALANVLDRAGTQDLDRRCAIGRARAGGASAGDDDVGRRGGWRRAGISDRAGAPCGTAWARPGSASTIADVTNNMVFMDFPRI
jgi:hypothetical protein